MTGFVLICFFFTVFLMYTRYMRYKETAALAKHGLVRESRSTNYTKSQRGGMITAAVGAAITLGMLPMVLSAGPEASPALLGGLVPLGVGLALVYLGPDPEEAQEQAIRLDDEAFEPEYEQLPQGKRKKGDPHSWQ